MTAPHGLRGLLHRRHVGPPLDPGAASPALDTTSIVGADAALATSRRRARQWLGVGLAGVLVAVGSITTVIAGGWFDDFYRNDSPPAWVPFVSIGWVAIVIYAPIVVGAGWLQIRRHRTLAAARASAQWSIHNYTWYVSPRGRGARFWVVLRSGEDVFEYRLHHCLRSWRHLRSDAPGVAFMLDAPGMVAVWVPGDSRIWTAY